MVPIEPGYSPIPIHTRVSVLFMEKKLMAIHPNVNVTERRCGGLVFYVDSLSKVVRISSKRIFFSMQVYKPLFLGGRELCGLAI